MKKKINEAKLYVNQWLQYQVLWDVPVSTVTERIGNDLESWQKLLQGVKLSRSTIETQKDEMSFGPIVINFKQVQNKVNIKYDTWQKELQHCFGLIVSEGLHNLHSKFFTIKKTIRINSIRWTNKRCYIRC